MAEKQIIGADQEALICVDDIDAARYALLLLGNDGLAIADDDMPLGNCCDWITSHYKKSQPYELLDEIGYQRIIDVLWTIKLQKGTNYPFPNIVDKARKLASSYELSLRMDRLFGIYKTTTQDQLRVLFPKKFPQKYYDYGPIDLDELSQIAAYIGCITWAYYDERENSWSGKWLYRDDGKVVYQAATSGYFKAEIEARLAVTIELIDSLYAIRRGK